MTDDKAVAALREKRAKFLKDTEDSILLRLKESWVNKLHDLVLYATMNAQGIRLADIPRLIRRALEEQVK